jgi:hypothetical protein
MLSHLLRLARIALAVTLLQLASERAAATLPFQKAFIREYAADHPDREYAAFVQRTAKCNVCHQGTKDRKNLNPYGNQLAKLLDYHTDNHDAEKISAALQTVATMPADPSRSDGPTYGERIADGELPAGDLENLKREPAE